MSYRVCTGVPWELLYADHFTVTADSLEECIVKLNMEGWHGGHRSKGQHETVKTVKCPKQY